MVLGYLQCQNSINPSFLPCYDDNGATLYVKIVLILIQIQIFKTQFREDILHNLIRNSNLLELNSQLQCLLTNHSWV